MIDTSVLTRLILPRSVAIVGASPQRGTARNSLVRVLLKHGFDGRVYPVSRSHAEIEGLRCYPSLAELPEVPDVALVITPAETVPDVIADCGRKGIRAAIVYSAGFEDAGESGRLLAARLADAARRHGVAVVGPNCQGVWAVRARTLMTFGAASVALETLKHAPIAIVSQSGALGGAIAAYLQKSDIGCSYALMVGNETCLDLVDMLGWVIEQDDVRVVALYLEGLADAARLIPIARRAAERGIQIVALKAGRSAIGQSAAASHTGKIASSFAVYADVFEQAGILSLDSLAEVMAAVEVFAFLPNPRVSGDPKGGVAVMSSSGGAGTLLADQSEAFGVPMSEFGPGTAATLEALLPAFGRAANPVDLTGQIRAVPTLFRDVCAAIGGDPRTEALVVQFASSGLRDLRENGEAFKAAVRQGGFPMVISTVAEEIDKATRQDFRDAGILLSGDTAATMRSLAWLYRRRALEARGAPPSRPALPSREAPAGWAATMAYLAESGITPARWVVLGPEDRAATACAGLAWPLVVKVLPEDAEHKTELGLVRLRVGSAAEVDAIAAEFRARLGKPGMGVLVQEMVGDGVEVVLSCLRGTDFGPVLSLGTGGIAVELFRDVIHLALPVSPDQVREAIARLKLATLLRGFRGKPAADADALTVAAVRFGDMFLATPDVTEFEVNPLIVRPAGQGVVAVDALVARQAKP
jgi:acyl-CoA synthetase (NDP forming)